MVFRDGAPGGESPSEVSDRADRVVARLREATGDVLIFRMATSSGRWRRAGWSFPWQRAPTSFWPGSGFHPSDTSTETGPSRR